MKYKKKPVVIEAIVWDGSNEKEVIGFCKGSAYMTLAEDGTYIIVIETLESDGRVQTRHAASVGDYIIRGVKDEHYPCKPDIFEMTYEPAE